MGRASRVALALALATSCALPCVALAKTSDEVRAEADREHERLEELAQELEDTRAELEAYEQQIDDLAKQSMKVQGMLVEDRGALADMVGTTYRIGTPTIVDIAFSSKTFEDFMSRLHYAESVTQWQTECVQALEADKLELSRHMDQIEEARQEREEVAAELDQTYDELSDTVQSLYAQAQSLEEEERAAEEARLAEIARQAELEQQRKQQEQAKADAERIAREEGAKQIQEAATTEQGSAESQNQADSTGSSQSSEPAPEEVAPEEPAPAPEATQSEDTPAQTDMSDAGDWIYCIASAYTIADNDPPGTTATASGIPLDESIPTVALPMSMSPSRFYGMRIQIEYQGMTVVATITDCGDMDGGNRGLDLTPAIFHAFGASTADDWGLRTVRYRFL